MSVLLVPLLTIMSPFIVMFPVGLGLKTIIATTLLVSIMFSLCITVFGFSRYKNRWAYLLFLAAFGFFIAAHLKSGFTEDRPKPNSLVYLYDADKNTAIWATYDHLLDDYTQAYLTDEPDVFDAATINFDSKYGTQLAYSKNTEVKALKPLYIDTQKDTIIGEARHFQVFISPQRAINTLEFYADPSNTFLSFNINGLEIEKKEGEESVFNERVKNRLFSYMVTEDKAIALDFTVPAAQKTTFEVFEVSFDLVNNDLFHVRNRPNTMIPKPFVLNDAIIIRKTITFE